jgi:chaperonin GroES
MMMEPAEVLDIKPYGDAVLIAMEIHPQPASGIVVVHPPKDPPVGTRIAKVLAVGPGRVDKRGKRHPIPLRAGDRVVILSDAGVTAQDYSWDDFEPRQTSGTEMMGGVRVIREDQALAVLDETT